MKNKEYYFNIWTRWVWGYNNVYEAPLENYPLRDNTEDSLDMLESYCRLIMTEGKRRKKYNKENSYELFSPSIQDAIQQVINLMCDGRELHAVVDVNNPNLPIKKFDHHLDKNGKLPFENDPFSICQLIVDDIPVVKEIINSVKETVNFEQFYDGMWYYFEGYETEVNVITEEEFKKEHRGMPHGGFVICSGNSGENNFVMEFKLSLDSNPEFTGSVLVAYARAIFRMYKEGKRGAYTIFDVPPSYLLSKTGENIRKELL